MKIKNVLADTTIKLSESGIEGSARDARILTAYALQIPISELSLKINEQVSGKITSKLETDANEIRWVCTTGCPSEVYGNYVLNRQNLNLKSAAENFMCVVLNSFEELEKSFTERVLELQKEYNSALEGNKI